MFLSSSGSDSLIQDHCARWRSVGIATIVALEPIGRDLCHPVQANDDEEGIPACVAQFTGCQPRKPDVHQSAKQLPKTRISCLGDLSDLARDSLTVQHKSTDATAVDQVVAGVGVPLDRTRLGPRIVNGSNLSYNTFVNGRDLGFHPHPLDRRFARIQDKDLGGREVVMSLTPVPVIWIAWP